MEVVVTGRHFEVTDRFREHVSEKLSRLEKHDHHIMRVQVEVQVEQNPRQQDRSTRVELTAFSRGPVIRAEAAAGDKMSALDMALDKMASQMRRAADRRLARRNRKAPRSLGDVMGAPEVAEVPEETDEVRERQVGPITVTGDGPLVGHDFYLFVDKESEKPSVVYRRRGYDYGVISLEVEA